MVVSVGLGGQVVRDGLAVVKISRYFDVFF